jgi:hypothetical protein
MHKPQQGHIALHAPCCILLKISQNLTNHGAHRTIRLESWRSFGCTPADTHNRDKTCPTTETRHTHNTAAWTNPVHTQLNSCADGRHKNTTVRTHMQKWLLHATHAAQLGESPQGALAPVLHKTDHAAHQHYGTQHVTAHGQQTHTHTHTHYTRT